MDKHLNKLIACHEELRVATIFFFQNLGKYIYVKINGPTNIRLNESCNYRNIFVNEISEQDR